MKIIAFGDIHMATDNLSSIKGLSEADLVVITGDLTNFGGSSDAKVVLNAILQFNPNVLCLAGNLDTPEVNDYLEDLNMNLHGQAHMLKRQVCLYGVGGSNVTPFHTPWEFSEKELTALVYEAHTQAQELVDLAAPLAGHLIPKIFVSHTPPAESNLDRLRNGSHAGSPTIRSHIEYQAPAVCITGHIHESKGKEYIDKTLVINPGMLADGGWVEITVTKTGISAQLQ